MTESRNPSPSGNTPPVAVPASVFISYASQDAEIARATCSALESAGYPCWIAPRDVVPGSLYADGIIRAINDSKILVLILSESSVASSHVGKEIERASSKRHPIIALRTDAAALPPAFEYFLSESQWIEIQKGDMASALTQLVGAVGQHLSTGSAAGASQSFAPPVTKSAVAKRGLLWGGATAMLALVLGAAYIVTHKDGLPGSAASVAVSDKSIAVLPFADLSEKHDQEYFADGIAEEVLDRLAKVPGLKVVGRASSFQFRGKTGDSAKIGAALGVAYLLEGSVRRDAERVRVTAQLVEAKTGAQPWSDHFDSDLLDVLKIQDSIAAELARALQIAVEASAVPRTSVKSPEVLEAYLRGQQQLSHFTRESTEAALADFQQARSGDSTFAPAAIGISNSYIALGKLGWLSTPIAFEHARETAILAQRLEPKNPVPHALLASIHLAYDWDWMGADRELQQSFALGPKDVDGLRTASSLASALGHWDEARQLAVKAIELDPLNADAIEGPGIEIYLRSDRLADAEQSFRRALAIAPELGSGRYFLGEALMLQGHFDAALIEFQRETLEDGQLEGSAMVQFAMGHKAESDAALAEAIRHNGDSWASEIARVYAFRGEAGQAFEWLEKAYAVRDEDLYFIKGDPLLKNLEGDPRYKAFLKKMNLPE